MPGIIGLVLIALVALVVLSFVVHFLFSPWLLVAAIGVLAWISSGRAAPASSGVPGRPDGRPSAPESRARRPTGVSRLVTGQEARRMSLRSGGGGVPGSSPGTRVRVIDGP